MKETDYRLAAIMYTDIVGFSRMMGENEAETLKLLEKHNNIIEEIVTANQGTVIKTIGDAYMVEFRNTVKALQSAIEVQAKLYEYNTQHEETKLLIRIGIHLGDIYFYENDALGEGINIAARLQSFANPGCICFSQDIFNQVLNKIDFHAENLGRVSLKNITKEIIAYEISSKNIEFDHEKSVRNRKVLHAAAPESPDASGEPGVTKGAEHTIGETESGSKKASDAKSLDPKDIDAKGNDKKTSDAAARPGADASPKAEAAPSSGSQKSASRAEQPRCQPVGSQSGSRPDSWFTAGDTAENRWETYKQTASGYAESAQTSRERPTAADGDRTSDTSNSSGGARTGTRESSGGKNWDINVDGKRLGMELNRALQGMVSLAERKLTTFIDNTAQNAEANRPGSSLGETMRRDRERGRGGEQYGNRVHGDPFAQGSMNVPHGQADMEDLWKQWTADKHGGHGQATDSEEIFRNAVNGFGRKRGKTGPWSFENIRLSYTEKFQRLRVGFLAHLISYAGVNAMLWWLNAVSNTTFPWAGIVSIAWGIGLLSNAAEVANANKTRKELERMTTLNEEQWQVYRKLEKTRNGMTQHTVSAFMVSALLIFIDIITGSRFHWSLIPAGVLILSWMGHFSGYGAKVNALKRQLCTLVNVRHWSDLFGRKRKSANMKNVSPGQKDSEYASLIAEAEDLRDTIVRQIKKSGRRSPLNRSNIQTLDDYVERIRGLADNIEELDGIIRSVPLAAIKRDRIELTVKMKNAEGQTLRAEYEKTITEIEKQEEACVKLSEQRDTLNLRLTSSVNTLKRMQLDMARMSAGSQVLDGTAIFDQIRNDSDDLSQYLEDIREGYREMDMEQDL